MHYEPEAPEDDAYAIGFVASFAAARRKGEQGGEREEYLKERFERVSTYRTRHLPRFFYLQ